MVSMFGTRLISAMRGLAAWRTLLMTSPCAAKVRCFEVVQNLVSCDSAQGFLSLTGLTAAPLFNASLSMSPIVTSTIATTGKNVTKKMTCLGVSLSLA